jgi:hypothetical protein
MCNKGHQHERYGVIAIMLRHFALSHNTSTLWRNVIAFHSYRSRLMEIVTTSYSNRSALVGNVIAFHSYRSENMTKAMTCNAVTFWSNVADLWLQGSSQRKNWQLCGLRGAWQLMDSVGLPIQFPVAQLLFLLSNVSFLVSHYIILSDLTVWIFLQFWLFNYFLQ